MQSLSLPYSTSRQEGAGHDGGDVWNVSNRLAHNNGALDESQHGAVGVSLAKVSDDGALGSGEMDGADPQGQGSLEVMEDVVGRAWTGALCRNLIQ